MAQSKQTKPADKEPQAPEPANTDKGLIASLLEVQKELQTKTLKRTAENPFHHSKYVPLKDLLDFTVPVLNKHGILLMQSISNQDGQPTMVTRLSKGDEVFADTMLLMLKSEDPQAQGSAVTYARRYQLTAVLGLEGEDDDGERATETATAQNVASGKPAARQPQVDNRPATDNQKNFMMTLMSRKHFTRQQAEEILTAKLGKQWDTLSMSEAKATIDELLSSATTKEMLEQYLEGNQPAQADDGDPGPEYQDEMPDDIPPPDDIEVREVSDND